MTDYLTIKEATKKFSLSKSTINNLIASGKIAKFKVGKRSLVSVANFEAFLESCRRQPVDVLNRNLTN